MLKCKKYLQELNMLKCKMSYWTLFYGSGNIKHGAFSRWPYEYLQEKPQKYLRNFQVRDTASRTAGEVLVSYGIFYDIIICKKFR